LKEIQSGIDTYLSTYLEFCISKYIQHQMQILATQSNHAPGLGLKYNSDHVALVNAYLGWKHASYLSEADKVNPDKRSQAGKVADEFLKKHFLSKEIMGGADQNMRSFMYLMSGTHGYDGQDSEDRI
jgi:hypothetical protein